MDTTPEFIDSIYLEKVKRARHRPVIEKILDGPRLFAFACESVRSGIRMQYPEASSDQIERFLRQRLELGRKIQDVSDE